MPVKEERTLAETESEVFNPIIHTPEDEKFFIKKKQNKKESNQRRSITDDEDEFINDDF